MPRLLATIVDLANIAGIQNSLDKIGHINYDLWYS